MQQYQGKQLCNIPDEIYDALGDVEITRANILKVLKEIGYAKHYKNAHRIYFDLTGTKVDDIAHLEDKLIRDYRLFIDAYYKLKVDRTNSLSVQYVLYQLLRRRGHPCDENNFNLPKTEGSRKFHDEICRQVFNELGWEFITS